MVSQFWILLVVAGLCTALEQVLHRTSEESLNSALNAVTRKQRSLGAGSQEYYNQPRSFNYHPEPERNSDVKYLGRVIDEDGEEIEFLNVPEAGQAETVEDNYLAPHGERLAQAILDYLDTITPIQEKTATSSFRERQRGSSPKRGSNLEGDNEDEEETAKLLLELLVPEEIPWLDRQQDLSDEEQTALLEVLTAYKEYLERGGAMTFSQFVTSLRELTKNGNNKLFDRMQSTPYLSPPQRRNVNGRYPVGREFGNYAGMVKRYPVAKRSPKPLLTKKQITDPKVAKELGALFGDTQAAEGQNHSHDHDHGRGGHDSQEAHGSTTEQPKAMPLAKGQKENASKVTKAKAKGIEVKKKSVDWSQYFGIDRRSKKAALMSRQGSRNQDDEWMLQRYYDTIWNMAEKPNEHETETSAEETRNESSRKEDKMSDRNFHVAAEKAMKLAGVTDDNPFEDKLISIMAAAYASNKMRKALNELRNSVAAQKTAKAQLSMDNATSSHQENEDVPWDKNKRANEGCTEMYSSADNYLYASTYKDDKCPELAALMRHCRATNVLKNAEERTIYYTPCMEYYLCEACREVTSTSDKVCWRVYAEDVNQACNDCSVVPWKAVRCVALQLHSTRELPTSSTCTVCMRRMYTFLKNKRELRRFED